MSMSMAPATVLQLLRGLSTPRLLTHIHQHRALGNHYHHYHQHYQHQHHLLHHQQQYLRLFTCTALPAAAPALFSILHTARGYSSTTSK